MLQPVDWMTPVFRVFQARKTAQGGLALNQDAFLFSPLGKRDFDRCVKQDLTGIRNGFEIIPLDLALQRWC